MITERHLDSRTARIAVIGTGMAGLYQCFEFCSQGFHVTGFDVDVELVARLAAGESPVPDVPAAELRSLLAAGRFRATTDEAALAGAGVFVISVPVLPAAVGTLDTGPLEAAAKLVARVASAPLVVVKTTVYPGMTEEVVLPVLAAQFGEPGRDFALVYASERADPGTRTLAATAALPKVLAGASPRCAELGRALYGLAGGPVHTARSIATAELVKLHENVFRFVNIAYVNELADLAARQGIDFAEVVRLAGTKPFGFMGFQPGPGVGGMYIPVNPVLLQWWAGAAGGRLATVDAAVAVNDAMASRVADRVVAHAGGTVAGRSVAALGVTYKPGSADLRNSAAARVVEELARRGAVVVPVDPHAVGRCVPGGATPVRDWTPALVNTVDLTVVLVAHPEFLADPPVVGDDAVLVDVAGRP